MRNRWPFVMAAMAMTGSATMPSRAQGSTVTQPLPLSYSNPRQSQAVPAPVTVTLALDGDSLIAHFKVVTAAVFAKPQLARNEYPYEYDVVELFVRNAASAVPTYHEFEVSPFDQSLQVDVMEPRQEYYFGVKNRFTHSAKIASWGWEADMKIPLATIGCDGSQPVQLIGNAYAALGDNDRRVYWSLFELPAGKPDFHVPGAFRPLISR